MSWLRTACAQSSIRRRISASSFMFPPKLHDPVRFPRLSAIRRVGLLPAGRCRGHARPDEARRRLSIVDHLFTIERARPVLEAAAHGRIDRAFGVASVNPPD